MNILSVGTMEGISNTCLLRTKALMNFSVVDVINTHRKKINLLYKINNRLFQMGLPVSLPDLSRANRQIREKINEKSYDILWIDKGLMINPRTLKYVRKVSPKTKIVNYSPDNMMLRHNQSQNYLNCIKLYDIHFTTKSYIADELVNIGAKRVLFVNQSYEESFHYPRNISEEDIKRLGADVGFVGAWEKERMDSILYLTRNGINVRVFGTKEWEQCAKDNPCLFIENHGLYDEDYAKSFKCFKISLCFLRKINFDLQTSRTMEIPACGGFMLAERTKEHQNLFAEGKEAVYFSTNEELLDLCNYYLTHESERLMISEAGYNRCINSGYSNTETLRRLVNIVLEL